jgi:hypothetical protein
MLDKQVFDALCGSQDGKCLERRLRAKPMEDQNDWGEALSDVILGAYRDADERDELLTHLRYCVRELQAAADAVRRLEESHVSHV